MKLKKRSLLFLVFGFISCLSFAQKSYILQTVAFYNLENLFDTINHPDKLDELSPIFEIKSNKTAVYKDKLLKLAGVLAKIGTQKSNTPPALIGIVEVENKTVIENLIATPPLNQYNYGIVHYESLDKRGIDTALLYNKDIFRPIYSKAIDPDLQKENKKVYTRDILWVTGFFMDEKTHILINHWPSRRGGAKKSSILREGAAAKTLEIITQIQKEDPNAKIIGMGDFNDNPTNKSFKKVLKTKSSKKRIEIGDLYNPYEKMFKEGFNTLTFRGEMFLFDQIFFSSNYLTQHKNYNEFRFYKAGIFNPSYMILQSGKYKGSPKRSFSGGTYLGGYSDHFPVYCYLLKENK